jgi:hypothetical protein
MPHRGGGPSREFEVRILSDAVSVQTQRGERLGGYIAEYTLDFRKHRTFVALEILRYEKGETLAVRGYFLEDSVRMSFGGQPEADFPVFRVRRAEPARLPPIPEIKGSEPRPQSESTKGAATEDETRAGSRRAKTGVRFPL